MNAALTISTMKEPRMLYLIRQPTSFAAEPPAGHSETVATEWTDPRYEELVKAWESVRPPSGIVGFIDPHP